MIWILVLHVVMGLVIWHTLPPTPEELKQLQREQHKQKVQAKLHREGQWLSPGEFTDYTGRCIDCGRVAHRSKGKTDCNFKKFPDGTYMLWHPALLWRCHDCREVFLFKEAVRTC